ncbi:MAG: hypothetical protein JKY42_03490 [Flavobacteriales bacterium]|nr:hypothetical protein [Flavobacteriales bacterium]
MRKVVSFIALLFTLVSSTRAQSDSTYTFTLHDGTIYPITIELNDPTLLPNLFFAAGVQLGTRPSNYLDFLIPIQGGIYFTNKVFIEAKVDIPLIARFDTQYDKLVQNENLQTTNKFYINTQIDVGGGYFFLDTTKLMPVKIKFNAKLANKKDTLMVAEFKGNIRQSLGVRGGYFHYQSVINTKYNPDLTNDPFFELTEQTESGTLYDGANTPIYHTNFRSHSLYLGIDFRKIYHMVYAQSSDTTVRRSRMYNVYADFMYSPFISIEEMSIRNFDSGETSDYSLESILTKRPWGFRVGGEATIPATDRSSFAVQLESGIRPGIKGVSSTDNFFGNLVFMQVRILYKFGTILDFNKTGKDEE